MVFYSRALDDPFTLPTPPPDSDTDLVARTASSLLLSGPGQSYGIVYFCPHSPPPLPCSAHSTILYEYFASVDAVVSV